MTRTMKAELTIEEAATATGKSVATIYRWLRVGRLRATETSAGPAIRTEHLLSVAARVRPGRPPGVGSR